MVSKNAPNDILKLQKKIGAKIRSIREEKGLKNYEKFAIQNGFGRSHYWRIEAGEVNLTLKTLSKVLNSLDTTIQDFFNQLEE